MKKKAYIPPFVEVIPCSTGDLLSSSNDEWTGDIFGKPSEFEDDTDPSNTQWHKIGRHYNTSIWSQDDDSTE